MTLRPYQLAAVAAIEAALLLVRSTLLVLATGLGKTVTFAAVAQRVVAAGDRVLVLAHRAELLDQAAATLRGFGLTVAIECGDQRVDHADLPQVVVASVQSLQRARLTAYAADSFSLIVIDESHHAVAKSYRAVLDHFTSAKVVGVTATSVRGDGVALGNIFESVAYEMSLADGIRAGWLCGLEMRTVRVESLDLSRVRTVAGDLSAGDLERELTTDRALHEVAAPLVELAVGRPTLCFTAGVQQAHALADVLRGYGVTAAAVDGSMAPEQRAAVRADFVAGRVQFVINCALWLEGFDAPETACVALAAPTTSSSRITQCIGRGTRLAPGKTNCLILDFTGAASRVRLASPADALAGAPLPDDVAAAVRELSGTATTGLDAVIEAAQALVAKRAAEQLELEHTQREERRRRVLSVGVHYAAPRLNIDELLAVVTEPGSGAGEPASLKQLTMLRNAGLDVPDTISRQTASALYGMLEKRRVAGLCSLKQARKLRQAGLRDDLSWSLASEALDAIAANGWRAPAHLKSDPRFAIPITELITAAGASVQRIHSVDVGREIRRAKLQARECS